MVSYSSLGITLWTKEDHPHLADGKTKTHKDEVNYLNLHNSNDKAGIWVQLSPLWLLSPSSFCLALLLLRKTIHQALTIWAKIKGHQLFGNTWQFREVRKKCQSTPGAEVLERKHFPYSSGDFRIRRNVEKSIITGKFFCFVIISQNLAWTMPMPRFCSLTSPWRKWERNWSPESRTFRAKESLTITSSNPFTLQRLREGLWYTKVTWLDSGSNRTTI